MSVGFQSFNDNGSLQFDTSLVTYYLKAKGTVTCDSSIGQFSPGGIIYDVGQEANQVYWNPSGTPGFDYTTDIVAWSYSGAPVSTYSSDGVAQGWVCTNTLNAVVSYWVFSPFNTYSPPTHGFGMQLFDESSHLLYDATLKPLRVQTVLPITSGYFGVSTFVPLPAGRTYAFIVNNPSIRQTFSTAGVNPTFNVSTGTYQPAPNGRTLGARAGTNGFYVEEVKNNQYTVGDYTSGTITVVDVTGY